jgi:uncharacterized protein (TIGR02301 family)
MARILSSFGMDRTRRRNAAAAGLFVCLAALALPPYGAGAEERTEEMENGLVRLAEILGAVHHLRDVCGAHEGSLWRNKMIDLLEAARPPAGRRQYLIGRFNDAYYRVRGTYPQCSPGAVREVNALFGEGQQLAAKLTSASGWLPGL